MTQQTGSRRIAVFLVLVTVLSAAAYLFDTRGVFGHAGSLVYMWCPGLAALLAGALTHRPLRAIGWTTRLKWLGIGWLIPITYATAAYGLVWLTGLGGVPKDTFLPRARLTLGMPAQPAWEVIAAAAGFIMVLSVLPGMISALGEEIGWRGLLVPELNASIGPRGACIVSGVAWSIWHLPAFLSGYGTTGTPWGYQMACFFVMVMTSAVVMAWLRLKSRSIWPTAIMHATHNAAIQMFFDRITAPKTYTPWLIGEFGCALLLPLIPMAWYCWHNLRSASAAQKSPAISAAAQRA